MHMNGVGLFFYTVKNHKCINTSKVFNQKKITVLSEKIIMHALMPMHLQITAHISVSLLLSTSENVQKMVLKQTYNSLSIANNMTKA